MLVHGCPFQQLDEGFGCRRVVSQGAVRPDDVVVFPPLLDDDLGFSQRVEDLSI
jgi:hypothetical protein